MTGKQNLRIGLITACDEIFRGEKKDPFSPRLKSLCETLPAEVVSERVLPQEIRRLSQEMIRLADRMGCDVVMTTGGSQGGDRAVTPDATREVIQEELPRVAALLKKKAGSQNSPSSCFCGTAGVRHQTLLINLPADLSLLENSFEALRAVIPTTVEEIKKRYRR